MEFLRNFRELSGKNVDLAGGKGASLGEMTQAGIPVPPGFVVLAPTFEAFLDATNLNSEIDSILDSVNHKEIHTVEDASEKIRALIMGATIPHDIRNSIVKEFKGLNAKYVAVRSSATAEDSSSAAWAGQLESYLNTTEENLLKNVQKCWASLFTPRAIFYRFEKKLHKQKISVAVVVQKMVQSEMSGIAFSVHPVTQDFNQMIIEAGLGLGEAIVSGQITPDSYVLEKKPLRILDKSVQVQTRGLYRASKGDTEWREIKEKVGGTQTLTDKQILEFANLILRIEAHYGFPCDIEWAREKGKFYIVQSRPITTLSSRSLVRQYQKFFTRELALIVMEYWQKGEFEGLSKVLRGATHFNPLFIKNESGLTDIYYDMNNPDTALNPLFDYFKNNPKEFDRSTREFEVQQKKVYGLIKNFNSKSFTKLFSAISNAWAFLPVWIQFGNIEDKTFPKNWVDKSYDLRDKFQTLEYGAGDTLRKAIEKQHPKYKEFADVISFKEAESGKIPSFTELGKRKQGFIYFEGHILTNLSKAAFAEKFKIDFVEELATIGGAVKILEKSNVEQKKELKTPDGKKWNLGITRNMSFWHQYMSLLGHFNHMKDFGILTKQENMSVSFNGTNTSIFLSEENAPVFTKLLKDALLNQKKMKRIEAKFKLGAGALLSATASCVKSLSVKNWNNLVERYIRFVPTLNITAFGGRIGTEELLKLLKEKGLPDSEIPEIAGTITYPNRHTPLFNSQIELLEIGAKVQKGHISPQKLEKMLSAWLELHGYIPVNFCDNPWTIDDARAQLENILKKDCAKEIKRTLSDHKKRILSANRLLKKINDRKITNFAKSLQQITFLNEFRKNVFSRASLEVREVFTVVAGMCGFESWRDCYYLTPFEIRDVLSGKKLSKNILISRQIVGYRINPDGSVSFLDKKTTNRFAEYLKSVQGAKSSAVSTDGVIRGFSANKGVIKAIAKVILSSKDFDKLKPGEILVTTMTSVDFVPVMERAGAFVTNEGGITSHASIIAREMNKPCILGTKNATQLIKDGDFVEVDADKGIVTIL